MKTLKNLLVLAVLALLLGSCSDEVTTNTTVVPEEMTCFSQVTEAPMPISGMFKTYMNDKGNHFWEESDRIWVQKDNGDYVRADSIRINAPQQADFFFTMGFGAESYPILYVGNGQSPEVVTIAAEQIQSSANNSSHYANSGDCARSTATKVDGNDRHYSFPELVREPSFLYFEPYLTHDLPTEMATLKKVTIKEKNGKNICGTYSFGHENGLDTARANVTNGGSEIVVYCGENAKAVEQGLMNADVDGNGFPLYKDKRPSENRVFVVIQPGQFDLEITYEVAYCYEQKPQHDYDEDHDIYSTQNWAKNITERKTVYVKESIAGDLQKNTFYYVRNKLDIPNPVLPTNVYPFDEYYMWGASEWFWEGVSNYPVHWDEFKATNMPEFGDTRWYDTGMTFRNDLQIPKYDESYKWAQGYCNKVYPGHNVHRQGNNGGGDWTNAMTANQATYYIYYGDPHYDNTTPWVLDEFNGAYTICYGGVWLKKKAKIEAEGHTFPNDDDSKMWTNLAAPWTPDIASGQTNQHFNGQQFNLRYIAPWSNYRKTYTNLTKFRETGEWKKPWELDATKSEDDYFFVPCLGRIEYQNPNHPGVPTYTLTSAQGFYWTRTPVMHNIGENQFYYNGSSEGDYMGEYDPTTTIDNAFYINIHYNYIALSWQQSSLYMKTGMRIATKGSSGMFK